jgi:proteasome lid subunit RPN8/RPN11
MAEKLVRPLVSAGSPRKARIPLHRAKRWLADGEKGRTPNVQVFVTQAAFRVINQHANSDLDNEVGGWLAGRWCRDIDTKAEYVVVEALLPAQQVRSGSTFLTFTHDSQVAMLAALEERHAKKGIVGWYHTHPRMGLFLSGYDMWLHEHFFPHPWQVALVIEPHSNTGGFFIRNTKDELDSRKHFGFYELLNRNMESSVDWRNLHAEQQPEPKEEKKDVKVEAKAPQAKPAEPVAAPPLPAVIEVQPKPHAQPEIKVAEQKPKAIVKTGDTQPVEVKTVVASPAKVEAKPAAPRQGVMKKFEAPKPPAKVNLHKKPETRNEQGGTKPGSSEEAS